MLVRGMRPQSVVSDDDEAELVRRRPEARVEHVDEAGHSVQGDTPVELAGLIADFVDTRGRGRRPMTAEDTPWTHPPSPSRWCGRSSLRWSGSTSTPPST